MSLLNNAPQRFRQGFRSIFLPEKTHLNHDTRHICMQQQPTSPEHSLRNQLSISINKNAKEATKLLLSNSRYGSTSRMHSIDTIRFDKDPCQLYPLVIITGQQNRSRTTQHSIHSPCTHPQHPIRRHCRRLWPSRPRSLCIPRQKRRSSDPCRTRCTIR